MQRHRFETSHPLRSEFLEPLTGQIRAPEQVDLPAMIRFFARLSSQTLRSRFLGTFGMGSMGMGTSTPLAAHCGMQRQENSVLARYVQAACLAENPWTLSRIVTGPACLSAEGESGYQAREVILALGELFIVPQQPVAELALLVGEPWQGRGVGTGLLKALLELARQRGIHRVTAEMYSHNAAMRKLCFRAGFEPVRGDDPSLIRADLWIDRITA